MLTWAVVHTCNSKQGESYPRDNRQDNPYGKGTVIVPVPSSTEVNLASDAVKCTQGEETYETVHSIMAPENMLLGFVGIIEL